MSYVLLPVLICGCGRQEDQSDEPAQLIKTISHPPLEAVIIADPGEVLLERDLFLTIRVTAPSGIAVSIKAGEDRFEGFTYNGPVDRTVPGEERTIIEKKIRLTPMVAGEYRIAPIAITYQDAASPGSQNWFHTPPLTLRLRNPGKVGGINLDIEPRRIPMSASSITFITVLAVLLICLAVLLPRIIRFILHQRYLRKLSPKERALYELRELLDKRLLEKSRIKDFYVELTFVVRRFIERSYGIRAPELTTEEFLLSISNNHSFTKNTTDLLKKFLEAADMVKFAAYTPSPDATQEMIKTAENYINSAELPERDKR